MLVTMINSCAQQCATIFNSTKTFNTFTAQPSLWALPPSQPTDEILITRAIFSARFYLLPATDSAAPAELCRRCAFNATLKSCTRKQIKTSQTAEGLTCVWVVNFAALLISPPRRTYGQRGSLLRCLVFPLFVFRFKAHSLDRGL